VSPGYLQSGTPLNNSQSITNAVQAAGPVHSRGTTKRPTEYPKTAPANESEMGAAASLLTQRDSR
jgi:hypothetical protein